MESPIIIALDFSNREQVDHFLNRFDTNGLFVKVGMELFYQQGPAIISDLKDRGCNIFLDLKLHDIPNTVKKAMKGLAGLGVDIVNVHAGGGRTMMEFALEGLDQGTPSSEKRPECIAVTQLTSTSQETMRNDLLIQGTMEKVVVSYAKLAQSAGLDGVVCSPLETQVIKLTCGSRFLTVTPGIRLAKNTADDQSRFTTPREARKFGSDYIVVGRSITQAKDPVQAYEQIQAEWSEAHE
ncbi:MAG TPA: orotidine-5'-phosphate decarboxylase [Bacillales bacterium]|nr:orotidine-5'-phosphate decarboxylase [Bacillales bacterium]